VRTFIVVFGDERSTRFRAPSWGERSSTFPMAKAHPPLRRSSPPHAAPPHPPPAPLRPARPATPPSPPLRPGRPSWPPVPGGLDGGAAP